MDFIKKAAEGMKGNSSSDTSNNNTSGQQDDYVDKGMSPLTLHSKIPVMYIY